MLLIIILPLIESLNAPCNICVGMKQVRNGPAHILMKHTTSKNISELANTVYL